jgi:hypothetical protein
MPAKTVFEWSAVAHENKYRLLPSDVESLIEHLRQEWYQVRTGYGDVSSAFGKPYQSDWGYTYQDNLPINGHVLIRVLFVDRDSDKFRIIVQGIERPVHASKRRPDAPKVGRYAWRLSRAIEKMLGERHQIAEENNPNVHRQSDEARPTGNHSIAE